MGNEASNIKVDFKSLDEASIQSLRQMFKAGPIKELPSSWNILPAPSKQNILKQFKNQQGLIDENKYIGFAARHLGISIEDHVRFLGILMSKEPPVKISDVKTALIILFSTLAHTYSTKFTDEDLMVQAESISVSLLHDAIHPNQKRKSTFRKKDEDLSKELDIDDLEKLIHENQLIEYAINQVLSACFNVKSKFIQRAKIPFSESFVSPLQLLFLNHHISLKYKNIWRPIFSTRTHGESFSKFAGVIINRGPTILIIKDNEGNIFGGYNTQSWRIGPTFFGSSDSFLFHVNPSMNIYEATPFNENYQYFNMKQKTMPNGLGQGGQLEYFAYWVDSEFGRIVTSPSCTTYYSPQLGVLEGKLSELEIWGLGDEPEDDGLGPGGSALNMDPELQAILEMSGKTFHSKAIREVDAKEEHEEAQD